MESYGSYEVTREISSVQGRTVFGAHKSGEAKSDGFVVKLFLASSAPGTDPGGPREESVAAGGRAIELQKQASSASRLVVPLLESGQDERGRWWVSKLYSRSVQKVIAGRVSLSSEDLFHLLHSVVLGALDFKKVCGRAHGNLKASNIFLTGAPKVRVSQVLLSDPLPASDDEAAACERADLRGVGTLLYQLVRRREMDEAGDWLILPIESSREWTERFGPKSSQWLALCNRLLDPQLARSDYSLEQLEKDLRLLKPKSAVSWPVLAASVAALVLGVGVILFLTHRQQFGQVRITSDPPGALLKTNGVTLGPAPKDLQIAAGTIVQVSAEWQDAFGAMVRKTNDEVVVQNGQTHSISFRFPYGVLAVNSSPAGAAVEINQTNVGVTPYRSPPLHAGSELTFSLRNVSGYLPTNGMVTLLSGETNWTVQLIKQPVQEPGTAYVEFDSEPQQGAEIFLDGKSFTKTLSKQAVREGMHEVKARFRDWPEKTLPLNVVAGRETNAHFYFEHNLISLSSDPPGATVWTGSRRFGLTPTNDVLVQTGRLTFRFELDGHEVLTRAVEVVDRKIDRRIQVIVAKLQATNAAVVVTVTPEGAEILDGATGSRLAVVAAGKPVSVVLKPGKHTLKVTAPGYQTEAKVFALASKERLSWNVELRREEVSFTFTSDPPGAEFYGSDGKKLTSNKVAWGNYSITARHPGYPKLEPVTREVLVARTNGKPEGFKFTYGTLVITSGPPGAAVFVKGTSQFLGETPLTNLFLIGDVQYDLASAGVKKSVGTSVVPGRTVFIGASFAEQLLNSVGMPFVPLRDGLWVGQYEVSQKEYTQLMGTNPSAIPRDLNQPVTMVSWNDAKDFCRKLTLTSQKSGLLAEGLEFTLPTVAQRGVFAGDAAEKLDLAVINQGKPQPIGSRKPNQFLLFDVGGNVWEWTANGKLIGDAFSSPVLSKPSLPQSPEDVGKGDVDVGFRVILVKPGSSVRR